MTFKPNIFISAFCCVVFAYDWYNNTPVPAWMALIWCFTTLLHELYDWLDQR